MAYVAVPKDLAKVRSKLIFNLTPRQLICFGAAALIGAPVYFLTRGALGSSLSTMLLVVLTLPFFFLAMYEKDGQPFEKVLWTMIQAKYLYPAERPYLAAPKRKAPGRAGDRTKPVPQKRRSKNKKKYGI
jgi:hypothetical protein